MCTHSQNFKNNDMKKMKLLSIMLLIVGLTSCDLLSDLGVITVGTKFSKEFTFSLNDTEKAIDYTEVIDLSANADLMEYANDRIQGYTVKKISIDITSYTGPETSTLTGNITYKFPDDASETTLGAVTELNLYDLFSKTESYELSPDQAVLDALSTGLMDNTELSIHVKGLFSETPIDAILIVTLHTDVKVDASVE